MTQDTSKEIEKQSERLDAIEAKQNLMEVKQAVNEVSVQAILSELKDLKNNTLTTSVLEQHFSQQKEDTEYLKNELKDFKKNIVRIVWAPIIAFMTAVGAWIVKQWNGV